MHLNPFKMYFHDGSATVIYGQGSARVTHVRIHFIVFRTFEDNVAKYRRFIGIAHLSSGVNYKRTHSPTDD